MRSRSADHVPLGMFSGSGRMLQTPFGVEDHDQEAICKSSAAAAAPARAQEAVGNDGSGLVSPSSAAPTHIYAQVIDDTLGRTLVAASSRDPQFAKSMAKDAQSAISPRTRRRRGHQGADQPTARVMQAWQVGQLIAQRAKALGIERSSSTAAAIFIMGVWRRWPKAPAMAAWTFRRGGIHAED